jgi:hypothetical protein
LYKSRSSTCLPTINNVNEYYVVMVFVSSILTLQLIKNRIMYKEELIDEIVDTTIDSIDEHMREYVENIQPELIGKGEKVYYDLMREVVKELSKRITIREKQQKFRYKE